MYNEAIKREFLEQGKRKETYMSLFKRTHAKENELGKDLFDFNVGELEEVISNEREIVLLRHYIDWAITWGYRKVNINSADLIGYI